MPGLPHSVPHDPCGLLPITGPSPRILILGSYPSVLSLEREEYYGNPKNRFWEVMEEIFSVPASLPYRDRTALLSKRGVAIWDIVASCERKGSADSQIKKPVPNDVSGFFRKHPT
ncbi:MAG TPA: DNA-deoxyinosine glycosylase, partial [Methanoregula sp.]|nr:DNA-deoxyinosine glycosylase [Methanoregula sp.]